MVISPRAPAEKPLETLGIWLEERYGSRVPLTGPAAGPQIRLVLDREKGLEMTAQVQHVAGYESVNGDVEV